MLFIGFWILIIFCEYIKGVNLFDKGGNICLVIKVKFYCYCLCNYEDVYYIYGCLSG